MKENSKIIFQREIERRLSDPGWSAVIALAVVEKTTVEKKEKFFRVASWIVPALTAVFSVIVIGSSGFNSGYLFNSTADEYMDYSSITGICGNEIDSLIEYVYYGRE